MPRRRFRIKRRQRANAGTARPKRAARLQPMDLDDAELHVDNPADHDHEHDHQNDPESTGLDDPDLSSSQHDHDYSFGR